MSNILALFNECTYYLYRRPTNMRKSFDSLCASANGGFFHGYPASWYFEIGQQGRVPAILGKRPDLFIENSPVLATDKVTAPILLMYNKKDADNYMQGIEFYNSLSRLGKRCWLLDYDEGSHGVDLPQDFRDYTIRITQFYDHYLKGAPAPKWMVEGIPAKLKGIENGYQLMPGMEP